MKRSSFRPWLWIICILAAFHPNCTRCCPSGSYGCSCKYAWESCPSSGCGSCNSCSTVKETSDSGAAFNFDDGGSTMAAPIAPVVDRPGGTIAFAGEYVIASIPTKDLAHVVRVEANALDEDPLTVRTMGDVALGKDVEPGRTIADASRARIALRRGGAIATVDLPSLAVEKTRVCAAPRGLALANDMLHIGCASGELLTLSASTNQEIKHRFLEPDLQDVALFGESIVASTKTAILVVDPDGKVTPREGSGSPRNATAFVSLAHLDVPIADLDVASDGALVVISDGDAWVQTSGAVDLVRVGAPGIARAAATGTITTGEIKRRVVAVQTDTLLVFYSLSRTPDVLAIEPLP